MRTNRFHLNQWASATIVVIGFLVLSGPSAWAATLNVPSVTYPSLAAAATASAAGDVINITSSYTDTGGSATVGSGKNNVTIQGNGFTVTCGTATWTNGVIRFQNASGGQVNDLTINGGGVGFAGNLLFVDGILAGNPTSATVTNSSFTNSSNNGMRVNNQGGSGATLTATNCQSFSNGGSGLAIQQNGSAIINSCQFYTNVQAGIITPSGGGTLTAQDAIIRDNAAGSAFGQVHYNHASLATHTFER